MGGRKVKGCPHANVAHCPLYVGMHIAGGPSCDDGKLDTGGCAVDRGRMTYAAGVRKLRLKLPEVVAGCEAAEAAAEAKAQRARNMRHLH